jgi:hypothetical protein
MFNIFDLKFFNILFNTVFSCFFRTPARFHLIKNQKRSDTFCGDLVFLWPFACSHVIRGKPDSRVVRPEHLFGTHWNSNRKDSNVLSKKLKKTFVLLLLIALPIGYFLWDMRQAQHMASDACSMAAKGKNLDEYLSAFSRKEYRIIRNDRECILVPRRGLGRYPCIVSHDGRIITGARTGFTD